MPNLLPLLLIFLLSTIPHLTLSSPDYLTQTPSNTYDYIVIGSGPGGGTLASNLALSGASILLLEAGDDQGSNLDEEVAGWFFLAYNDPLMRWDFFVKYHSDENLNAQFTHLTWRTPDGGFYVGATGAPEGSELLGVYYPRAGTLGGCSTHNALCAPLPSDSDWNYIAELTGDSSWTASNMKNYFIKLENDHSVPLGTPGHGFAGFLDITVNDNTLLANQTGAQVVLSSIASAFNEDPSEIFTLIHRDLNNDSPNRDLQTGIFGFPAHRTPNGRRVSARNAIEIALNKTSKLNLSLESLATKILFDTEGEFPEAVGVEYLSGKSLYSADPRYNASVSGTTKRAFARKEVILSGGAFNSPQLLKLSGIGPKAELESFGIEVVVDLPGVGANLQDNNELGLIASAPQPFVSIAPACTYGAPGDPCLAAWEVGKGPYTTGPLDAIMFQSSNATERDFFMWGTPGSYRGYWPSDTVNTVQPVDGPNEYDWAMVKIHPESHAGTVLLRSTDPRDVPDINFRFFEGGDDGIKDLEAMAEAVDFARSVLKTVEAPWGPLVENFPCVNGTGTCDVIETVRAQTWSHHATSSCAIGADSDPLAVLDSEFRVRGAKGLRVVDASAFPRTPGAFPVIPTFMLSEKASEVIAREGGWL